VSETSTISTLPRVKWWCSRCLAWALLIIW